MLRNAPGVIFLAVCLAVASGNQLIKVPPSAQSAQPASGQGTQKEKTLEEWITALQSPDRDIRIAGSKAILALGNQAKAAIPLLIRALEDTDPLVRYNVTLALIKMDQEAVPELLKAKASPNQTTRYYASVALKKIGGKPSDVKTFQGTLTRDDPLDTVRKNCYCKVYTVDLKKGDSCIIDLQSKAYDSFLRLEDSAKKQLAQDDDGGGFPHARISFTAPATGSYRIIVTTYAPKKTGDYSLTVKQFSDSGN